MIDGKVIRENLEKVYERIEAAAKRAGRDARSITLVAVTKTFGPEAVLAAYEAGQRHFGENYVQEARAKIEAVNKPDIVWHMIGHLQTNKAKYAVKMFDLVETVDSVKLANELNKRAGKVGKVQKVLIEVNLGGEESKSGCDEAGAFELAEYVGSLPNLELLGLMTIPPFLPPEEVRPYFRRLRELAERIEAKGYPGVSMKHLSMGMSADFEVAIEEGATIVRVGTAIFGPRTPKCEIK